MADIPIKIITAGPRHIVRGIDANGNKVEYEISDAAFKAMKGNDPPPGLSFAEWHSGTKATGWRGRYTILGGTLVIGPNNTRTTFVMPGEVAEEIASYQLGLPDDVTTKARRILTIPKTDLANPADFTSLKDKSTLSQYGVVDITATTLTVTG